MENIQETITTQLPRDERVGLLAYQIWEEEGCPDGKAEDHWLRACEMVDAEIAFAENQELPEWLDRQDKKPPAVETLKPQRRSAA
ncbi:MAG TPA: DUF2934 domain-containing protein [Aestuariivirga sp.]